jgi:hypothetical protein
MNRAYVAVQLRAKGALGCQGRRLAATPQPEAAYVAGPTQL